MRSLRIKRSSVGSANDVAALTGLVLCFLLIVVPFHLTFLKLALLGLMGLLAAPAYLGGFSSVSKHQLQVLLVPILLAAIGAMLIVISLISSSTTESIGSVPIDLVHEYILLPLVAVIYAFAFREVRYIQSVVVCLLISAVVVSLTVLAHRLALEGNLGIVLNAFQRYEITVRIDKSPRMISSLVFLLPFVVSMAFIAIATKAVSRIQTLCLCAVLTVCVCAAIFSDRRILIVLVLWSIVATMVLATRAKLFSARKTIQLGVGVVFAVTVIVGAVEFTTGALSSRTIPGMTQAFDPEAEVGAFVRFTQIGYSIDTFSEEPVWGVGLGNPLKGYIRQEERPWRYEMRYIALMAQVGVVGLLLYLVPAVLFLVLTSIVLKKGGANIPGALPIIVAFSAVMLAEGTNPYLTQLGRSWIPGVTIALLFAVNGASVVRGARLVKVLGVSSNTNIVRVMSSHKSTAETEEKGK